MKELSSLEDYNYFYYLLFNLKKDKKDGKIRMTYIKWKCTYCNEIKVSNSLRRHTMDTCKCGLSSLDLEEDYARMIGGYKFIKEYNYNFFDELICCCLEQDIDLGLFKLKEIMIPLETIYKIRKIEDKIVRSLELE